MIDKNVPKNQSKFNKKQKPSDLLELEVKKQEEELNLIKALLNNKELRDNEIKKLNPKKPNNNPNKLNPISKEDIQKKPRQTSLNPSKLTKGIEKPSSKALKEKPIKQKNDSVTLLETTKDETPKINNTIKQSNIVKEIKISNEKKETPQEKNTSKNEWLSNYNNNNLDNYKFRKSLTKKNEKVEINCYQVDKIVERNENTKEIDLLKEKTEEITSENKKKEEIDENQSEVEDNRCPFIKEILEEIKLTQYYKLFLEKDITSLEKLFLLEDKDLEAFVPIGHRIKIFKKIKEIKQLYEVYLETSENPITKGEDKQIDEFFSNEENENENVIVKKDTKTKFQFGETSFNEEGIQAINDLLPINVVKICCWNCLTVIDKNKAVVNQITSYKTFCSSNCFDKYLEKHFAKCSNKGCSKQIEKENAIYINNKVYCIDHSNTNAETTEHLNVLQYDQKDEGNLEVESNEDSGSYDPMLDF